MHTKSDDMLRLPTIENNQPQDDDSEESTDMLARDFEVSCVGGKRQSTSHSQRTSIGSTVRKLSAE